MTAHIDDPHVAVRRQNDSGSLPKFTRSGSFSSYCSYMCAGAVKHLEFLRETIDNPDTAGAIDLYRLHTTE
jgi:hypothetical protein